MKNPESKCSDLQLLAMLQDELDEKQSSEVFDHISVCPQCQLRCGELAASPAEWRQIVDALSSESDQPGFRPTNVNYESLLTQSCWNESMAKKLLSPPSHPEMLGSIGRYEVERTIGVGGMGVVFKAYDSELARPVAIKVLAPFLAGNATAAQRFAREARAAAAVVHQHVVPIHNVEINRESPFLVMHYVAGESLQARIDRTGALDLAEILRIGMQVASGLAAAHQQGLVHRDIKPSNILLEEAGVERALITDFGLAQAADDVQMTRTGVFVGTPQYMSPEQARGESVDHKSDLFSLGSVLYTLCTGRPAFRAASTLATMRRITDEQPTPIRQLNPAIPGWLSNIIVKLLSKAKQERFSSAEQLAELLAGCLAHVQQPDSVSLPEEAARLSATSRQPSMFNQGKFAMASILVLLLATISGIGAFLAYSGKSNSAKSDSSRSNGITPDANDNQALNYVLGHGYSRAGEKILFNDIPIEDREKYAEDFARTKEGKFQLAENVDADSFSALSETYTKDRSSVYLKLIKSGQSFFVKLPEADSATFQVLSDKLATDSRNAWWYGQKIPDIDSKSVKVVHDGFIWKSTAGVWFQNYQIKDADPESFEHLGQQYYRDANRVYWTSAPIADAEPLTFRVYGNDLPYGADRDSVWREGRKIAVVDSSTFEPIHAYVYKDKNGAYADGKRISKVQPESFRLLARLDDRWAALLTDGKNYFIYLSPIEGLFQIESNGESLILTQEIPQASIDEQKINEELRIVLDKEGRSSELVPEKYKSKVDLTLSMHREQLLKARSLLVSRKKTYSFESIGVPGNIVAISADQQTVILLKHPGVDQPIFGQPSLWDFERQEEHSVLPESKGWNWSFVPNRKICLAASLKQGRVRLWNYSQQEWFGDWISTMPTEDLGVEQIIAFSPNGRVMAVIDETGNPQFWSLTESMPVLINETKPLSQKGAGSLQRGSEKTTILASPSPSKGQTPFGMPLGMGSKESVRENGSAELGLPLSIEFSSDGKYCFMNSGRKLTVWDSSTGKGAAGPFKHGLNDLVYLSETGQLATIDQRHELEGEMTTITIRSATANWAIQQSFDVPGKVESAKWLGGKHLLTTIASQPAPENAAIPSLVSAHVIPTHSDERGDLKPIREVVSTAVVNDGKHWIGIKGHSVFCMGLESSKPLWETLIEPMSVKEGEKILFKALPANRHWIAIEQQAKSSVLTVLDLETGIEMLTIKAALKPMLDGRCIAESYKVHRDNTRPLSHDQE